MWHGRLSPRVVQHGIPYGSTYSRPPGEEAGHDLTRRPAWVTTRPVDEVLCPTHGWHDHLGDPCSFCRRLAARGRFPRRRYAVPYGAAHGNGRRHGLTHVKNSG